ncbi:riboflavin synthase [Arenimonas caeni]|jgi:riboflavin synthase|uniref:Riboflavin synthase n=1 Tax=Arenimonas caeni TaxID=2058085 RepID=A0A2P6MC08_9GAMM|nr:riboflavin synthase [Arenimonas caeni]MDY0023247.1 riboflavin synthase [Arenimonas caeni]PRH83530.1 riboflavin synthase [Arenimonas caeni]
MFTGLIQSVGRLLAREARGGDQRLRFSWGSLAHDDIALGESIAVSGCCLTVVAWDDEGWDADVSNETLALTKLGSLAIGAAVNLERSLLPTDRLGGHLVSGHVDAVGRVEKVWDDGRSQRWRFGAPPSVLRYVAVKGSIAVDGTSLTVNAVDAGGFEVNLVPHTVAHTAFGETKPGDPVNLEVDTVARYVERLLAAREEQS